MFGIKKIVEDIDNISRNIETIKLSELEKINQKLDEIYHMLKHSALVFDKILKKEPKADKPKKPKKVKEEK